MARREARPPAGRAVRLTPKRMHCVNCEQRLWVAYHAQRTLMTFRGLVHLTLVVRRCHNQECDLYHLPYRAEEEGAWALPHGEFGLDIITVVGQLRYGERRASGRRGAIAALVVRGPVRVLTALALRRQCFLPRALLLHDYEAWYTMREHLTLRREARRQQLRFRKDPAAYLAALEEILLKTSLPP
jgi:hypothetical protein